MGRARLRSTENMILSGFVLALICMIIFMPAAEALSVSVVTGVSGAKTVGDTINFSVRLCTSSFEVITGISGASFTISGSHSASGSLSQQASSVWQGSFGYGQYPDLTYGNGLGHGNCTDFSGTYTIPSGWTDGGSHTLTYAITYTGGSGGTLSGTIGSFDVTPVGGVEPPPKGATGTPGGIGSLAGSAGAAASWSSYQGSIASSLASYGIDVSGILALLDQANQAIEEGDLDLANLLLQQAQSQTPAAFVQSQQSHEQTLEAPSGQQLEDLASQLLGRDLTETERQAIQQQSQGVSGASVSRDVMVINVIYPDGTSSTITANSITFTPEGGGQSLIIVENIPKEFASDVSNIVFSTAPAIIIQADPIVSWRISGGAPVTISYSTQGAKDLTEIAKDFANPLVLAGLPEAAPPAPPSEGEVCGNGVCGSGENSMNCCNDCGCPAGQNCQQNICVAAGIIPETKCGNRICDTGESQETCCTDCGCPEGMSCILNSCIEEEAAGFDIIPVAIGALLIGGVVVLAVLLFFLKKPGIPKDYEESESGADESGKEKGY